MEIATELITKGVVDKTRLLVQEEAFEPLMVFKKLVPPLEKSLDFSTRTFLFLEHLVRSVK